MLYYRVGAAEFSFKRPPFKPDNSGNAGPTAKKRRRAPSVCEAGINIIKL